MRNWGWGDLVGDGEGRIGRHLERDRLRERRGSLTSTFLKDLSPRTPPSLSFPFSPSLEFEFPFPGSLTSTFLGEGGLVGDDDGCIGRHRKVDRKVDVRLPDFEGWWMVGRWKVDVRLPCRR